MQWSPTLHCPYFYKLSLHHRSLSFIWSHHKAFYQPTKIWSICRTPGYKGNIVYRLAEVAFGDFNYVLNATLFIYKLTMPFYPTNKIPSLLCLHFIRLKE